MGTNNQKTLSDDELIEASFNEALTGLQKSLGNDYGGGRNKPKKGDTDDGRTLKKKRGDDDDDDDDEEGAGEEEDTEYSKSFSKALADDPEAAMAMDVEPFLRQLVKSMGETISNLSKSIDLRIGKVEDLVKSQGSLILETAKLEKSMSERLQKIGEQPMPSRSVRQLQKSRFEGAPGSGAVDNITILRKSQEWVRSGKTDVVEASMIEGRINKGTLGQLNDRLDQKVAALMKEVG